MTPIPSNPPTERVSNRKKELPAKESDISPGLKAEWSIWTRWGKILPPITDTTSEGAQCDPPDWKPGQRVIAAFRNFADQETLHLARLLDESDELLTPLTDPFRLSFRKHRWLDLERNREESYSDWLAWLLTEMDSTTAVLRLFGLERTEFGEQVQGEATHVTREEHIRTDGGNKRLDIVIRFGEVGTLLIEVKVRAIEDAGGRDSLPIYLEWLKKQKASRSRYYAILLVPGPVGLIGEEWDVQTWDQVSLRLRTQASGLGEPAHGTSLLSALLLCFAGAVEQNVLGLAGPEMALVAPQTALYLKRFLEEKRQ
jgi:hypothetical protein